MTAGRVVDVSVATIRAELPAPIAFGDWVMVDREFVVVRLTSLSGHQGFGFALTRDGCVGEQILKSVAPLYIGTDVADREQTFNIARRRNLASHSTGIGLRAQSVVDLAAWDLAGQVADRSVSDLLGGRPQALPATAIVGYPPTQLTSKEVGLQARNLYESGWRRFKAPVSGDIATSAERLIAVRSEASECWVGCDAGWTFDTVESALEFLELAAPAQLGWFEDVFPPGDVELVRELRSRTSVPIAMGDEQGGSYYPDALLAGEAVDVIRIDLTSMGGITGGKRVIDRCLAGGVAMAPHMFAHIHSRVFSALGLLDVPIEWGVPGTGVDPYADSLEQPTVRNGFMEPLSESPGFGCLLDLEWARLQPHHDPSGIFR